jgi:hypothetical protein
MRRLPSSDSDDAGYRWIAATARLIALKITYL